MEPNFCMENGLKTMETMDSMINIGGYGIWEWGTSLKHSKNNKLDIFENKPILQALAIMAIPTIISQLITLIYNIAEIWLSD